jgi:hypothetical protein
MQRNKALRKGKGEKKTKLTPEELKEIEMCNVTSKALKKAIKPFSSKNKSNFVSLCSTVIPATVVVAGVVAYTLTSCCDLEWCRNTLMAQYMNCTT